MSIEDRIKKALATEGLELLGTPSSTFTVSGESQRCYAIREIPEPSIGERIAAQAFIVSSGNVQCVTSDYSPYNIVLKPLFPKDVVEAHSLVVTQIASHCDHAAREAIDRAIACINNEFPQIQEGAQVDRIVKAIRAIAPKAGAA